MGKIIPTTTVAPKPQPTRFPPVSAPPVVIVLTPPTTTTIPPVARLSVTNADFGQVTVGALSAPQGVSVVNDGNVALSVVSVTTDGPFVAGDSTCPVGLTLNPGQTCIVQVSFGPTNTGPQNGQLVLAASGAPGSVGATGVGTLTGSGSRNSISIEPPAFSFGSVLLGDVVPTADLAVRNSGTGPVKVATIAFGPNAKGFSVVQKGCAGITLAPQATCPFQVTVKPAAAGSRSVLVVATGAAGETAQATLRISVSVAKLSITPVPLLLGSVTVAKPAPVKSLTVRNVGGVPVKIASVVLTGPQAVEFAVTADGCTGKTLAPKKTCPVAVVGTPAQPGLRAVEVLVNSSLKTPTKGAVRVVGQPLVVATTAAPTTVPVPTVARFTPTLVMNPGVGTPGRVTEAQGSGFPANTPVQLAWEGRSVLVETVTDASGNFRVPIVILPGERPGTRAMTVVDQVPAFSGVRAPYLLQLGTFRPPGDAGRSGSLVGRG